MTNVQGEDSEPYVIPLSADGTEAISFDTSAPGGWAAYFSDEVARTGALVFVRVGPEGGDPGQPTVTDDGQAAITWRPESYSRVPFEIRELRVALPSGSVGFASTPLREVPVTRIEAAINHPSHRERLISLVMPSNAIIAGEVPGGNLYMRRPAPIKPRRPNLKVTDPGGYRKPDKFYEQVAEKYLWLAAISVRPAQELADINGVPVGTVHRWIREAKTRRLLLLPAHRGEAARPST